MCIFVFICPWALISDIILIVYPDHLGVISDRFSYYARAQYIHIYYIVYIARGREGVDHRRNNRKGDRTDPYV